MRTNPIGIVVSAVLLMAGCDLFEFRETPPLPGDRISVLLHQRVLTPDPTLARAEILLPAPTRNREWPQAGGYANHAMHHTMVGETLKEAWSVDIGAGTGSEERLIGSPVVAAGRVFAMDSESVVSAFEAASGRRLWESELTPEEEDDGHIGGGLAYEGGRLFVTTGFGEVIALDASSGRVLWRRSVGAPMRTPPTARDGRVFAVTVDNTLNALNSQTGEELWTPHTGIAEPASILGGGSPAVDAGVVVVAYSSGELTALKVENGRVLWTDSLAAVRRTDVVSSLSHIRGRPVIDRGRVFAMSFSGLMVAIDLRAGRRLWEREIAGLESPWVAGDYVYVLTADAEIVCLSRDDGRIYWIRGLPRYEDEEDRETPIVWTGPLLASDRLIIAGSHGEAWSVSPYTGRLLGKKEMPDSVSIAPIVADGSIYILSDDAELVAYR